MILQAPVDGGSHGSYQEPLALAFLWGFLFGRKDFPKGEPIETSRITFLRSKVLMMSSQRGITWVSKLSFDSLNHLGEPMSFWIKMGTSRLFFFWFSFSCQNRPEAPRKGVFTNPAAQRGSTPTLSTAGPFWDISGTVFEWIPSDWGTSEVFEVSTCNFSRVWLDDLITKFGGGVADGWFFFVWKRGVILSHSSDFPMFSRILLV